MEGCLGTLEEEQGILEGWDGTRVRVSPTYESDSMDWSYQGQSGLGGEKPVQGPPGPRAQTQFRRTGVSDFFSATNRSGSTSVGGAVLPILG